MGRRRLTRLLVASMGALLMASGSTGIAHAGDAADVRLHGERVPGVGIRLTFGDQTCLVKSRGDCRTFVREAVTSGRLTISGDLRRVRFAGLRLANVDFSGARLNRADFRGANLRGAVFVGADLRNATFAPRKIKRGARAVPRETKCQTVGDVDIYCDQAHLDGAKFSYADMRGVDFSHATMTRVQMWESDARGADFTLATLERSVLQYTKFDNATFNTTLLRSAGVAANTFNDANMYKALFYGASVTENDFIGTDLTKTNFQGSLLRYNDFSGALWSSTTCPDYTKTSSGCPQDG
jgi:uncharacterized protein YjbI with pentapeptide repeats